MKFLTISYFLIFVSFLGSLNRSRNRSCTKHIAQLSRHKKQKLQLTSSIKHAHSSFGAFELRTKPEF